MAGTEFSAHLDIKNRASCSIRTFRTIICLSKIIFTCPRDGCMGWWLRAAPGRQTSAEHSGSSEPGWKPLT